MQPSRRPIEVPALTPDHAWDGVRKWQSNGEHALSAADKLAWLFLWQRSRQGRERIAVTPSEVAADQNVTSDAGRQRLKNLRDIGLVHVRKVPDSRGVWIVELPNPERVAGALQVKWDAQRVLEFLEEQTQDAVAYSGAGSAAGPAFAASSKDLPAEEPTEGPTEEPTEVPRPSLLSSSSCTYIPSSIFSGSSREDSDYRRASGEEPRRGTSGGSSVGGGRAGEGRRSELPALKPHQAEQLAANPPKEAAALAMGMLARIPSVEQQELAVLDYEANILRRVNCPNMDAKSARKISRECYSRKLRKEAVDDLLDNLEACRRAKKLEVPASVYFHVGMRRIRSRAASGEAD